ncbi:MAG: hypothetical protein WD872_18310 [Pirellulaceae bacterium]
MASLSDEELPLDELPTTPYPTAVRSPASEDVAAESASEPPATSENESVAKPVADVEDPPASAAPPASSKAQEPPKPISTRPAGLAPLAFVPSPLRMNRAPEPIAVQMPPAGAPAAADQTPATPPPAATFADNGTPGLAPIVSPQETLIAAAAPAVLSVAATAAARPATLPAIEQSPADRLAALTQQRDVLIAMLEDEIQVRKAQAAEDADLARLEQELRLLYAAARRTDDAARAVESLNPSEREAYKHLMFGLSTWLTEETHRAPLRNARVMRSLREASSELAAASKLDLRNLALCERVESFGWFTEFARNDFAAKQQVILYVEVNNFVALEKSPTAFETELQGHYQIFDARGNIVAERKLPLDRELCRNYRRDYFLAYPIYMPDGIAAGQYRLELTVEDLKATQDYQGRKFGEGMIEFTIRN